MGRRQAAGVLCVDKPKGLSSRDVVNIVAGLARHNRVGHAGTLDPLATGVLVICLGWATRLVPLLHLQTKRYRAHFRLGATSDTDDATGTIQEVPTVVAPARDEIEALLPRYTGKILQVPPAFSAIHTDGERAYQKARRGEVTDLAARPVEVQSLKLRNYDFPVVELEIECGSGTYIRAIGRDLGRDLGCGALMSELVRTGVGSFTVEQAVNPGALDRATWRESLLPPLAVLGHLPQRPCSLLELELLANGRPIPAPFGVAVATSSIEPARVALVSPAGELVAVGDFDAARGVIQPSHVFPDAVREALQAGASGP